jgi:hypothetical protein
MLNLLQWNKLTNQLVPLLHIPVLVLKRGKPQVLLVLLVLA